jgi:hypothetical protein
MEDLSELENIIKDPKRKIIVSELIVDFSNPSPNTLFIIMIAETPGAAGGRAAGFGQRTIERVLCFKTEGSSATKLIDSTHEDVLSSVDLPVGIARMPAVMSDGSEEMLYGVVDPSLVNDYRRLLLG